MGVLYELALRSREITWSSYVFAQDVEMTFIVKVKEASLSGVSIDTTTVRGVQHLLCRPSAGPGGADGLG